MLRLLATAFVACVGYSTWCPHYSPRFQTCKHARLVKGRTWYISKKVLWNIPSHEKKDHDIGYSIGSIPLSSLLPCQFGHPRCIDSKVTSIPRTSLQSINISGIELAHYKRKILHCKIITASVPVKYRPRYHYYVHIEGLQYPRWTQKRHIARIVYKPYSVLMTPCDTTTRYVMSVPVKYRYQYDYC